MRIDCSSNAGGEFAPFEIINALAGHRRRRRRCRRHSVRNITMAGLCVCVCVCVAMERLYRDFGGKCVSIENIRMHLFMRGTPLQVCSNRHLHVCRLIG